ncbi:DUF268 domain-containing protein [Methylococcus sp. EFPC2]|uniref:DUF268 domain-containing protein n=1 Tax=Methylococcus sp. EFPC2 TaxID=2812648 RepID=UPI0019689299|nr:DUF268 domain-containing protein [Methylococcus sp. EFPC2]QSA98302.1 DUF268 domain-containing protein [Methylococcus sp. EFPC2]
MKKIIKLLVRLPLILLLSPRQGLRTLRGLILFFRDYLTLKKQVPLAVKEFPFGALFPCIEDRFDEGGVAKGHYFHQDLLVARRIFQNEPKTHVDVGSRIDGFVAHVASFRPIKVVDIRPLSNKVPNIEFVRADLMADLDQSLVDSCDSLSCLHALEHFGLGRYGDTVDYDGYVRGFDNLYKIVKPGGKFYFSVPIGPQRIEFNAHRVFSVDYLMECFAGKYRVDFISFVDDRGDLHEHVQYEQKDLAGNFGCWLGCGIFELTKL